MSSSIQTRLDLYGSHILLNPQNACHPCLSPVASSKAHCILLDNQSQDFFYDNESLDFIFEV